MILTIGRKGGIWGLLAESTWVVGDFAQHLRAAIATTTIAMSAKRTLPPPLATAAQIGLRRSLLA